MGYSPDQATRLLQLATELQDILNILKSGGVKGTGLSILVASYGQIAEGLQLEPREDHLPTEALRVAWGAVDSLIGRINGILLEMAEDLMAKRLRNEALFDLRTPALTKTTSN